MHWPRTLWIPACVVAVALLAGACSADSNSVSSTLETLAPAGQTTEPPPPGENNAGELGVLVADVVVNVEDFWGQAFPEHYGADLEPLGGVVSYDAANDPLESIPTCETELEDRSYAENAFYCPLDDTILWDHGVLFPEIQSSFGDFAVATVLAHEYGHVIQARLGVFEPGAEPVAGVYLELQADCFAGAWVATVEQEGGEVGSSQVDFDEALGGLIFVSDPVGTSSSEPGAHGNAFDRVNAFSEGLFDGVGACTGYLEDPPEVTARSFQSNELLSQGNLSQEEVVPLVLGSLELFWTAEFELVFGFPYDAPDYVPTMPLSSPPPACSGLEAHPARFERLATYCTVQDHVIADTELLLPSLALIGDFAVTYPIVHAWSQQVLLAGVGAIPEEGPVLAGDCVSGAWTRAIFQGQGNLGLSAGDIDEAILSFGVYTPTGPDGEPQNDAPETIARVEAFGRGFFEGTQSCLN